jgi:uncharacterized protein (TIGR01777 family)
MDVAITGSSGLIGSALREALRADGHRVLAVVRRPAGRDETTWDPEAGTIDSQAFAGLDAVVHLAGAGIADKRWTAERRRLLLHSREASTRLLATTLASLDRPPRVLLSGSAVGYYGDRGDEVLSETSPPGKGFLADLCRTWEATTAPAAAAGIRVAHLRTGLVLAPGGGLLSRMVPLFRLGLGGRLGSGRQYWPWVSLADEVGAIRWLLDHDVSGPVNLTAAGPVTNAEFTRVLAEVVHRPALLPVPAFGPGLLLGRDLARGLIFASARALPTVLEAGGYRFHHPDLHSALEAAVHPEAGTVRSAARAGGEAT